MANNNMKMVTLRSSDKVEFEVSEAVASKSPVVRHMIEDDSAQDVIPICNVDSKTLSKVIEYCTMHISSSKSEKEAHDHTSKRLKTEEAPSADLDHLKQWDAEFVNVDVDILCRLCFAANDLDIWDLLDLVCRKITELITGKSPAAIRKIFNIKWDFTPEEEAEIRH